MNAQRIERDSFGSIEVPAEQFDAWVRPENMTREK